MIRPRILAALIPAAPGLIPLLAFSLMMTVSCDRPVKPPVAPEPVGDTPVEPASVPQAAPSAAAPETADPPASAPSEPPAFAEIVPAPASDEGWPVIDIVETGNKITVRGHISSKYQASDLIAGITNHFPEAEVINELKVDPNATEVGWGNRLVDLVLPLLFHVTDAKFHYENGDTRLEGTVKDPKQVEQFQKLTASVMIGYDAKTITNQLKPEEEPKP